MKDQTVVCFGETLWDVLPDDKVAGGAPMNVAIRLASWGHPVKLISRIGSDKDGSHLIEILQQQRVDVSLVQQDLSLPTGNVLVTLSEAGNASYDIVQPSAWDAIESTTENFKAVAESAAFVFGCLAARNKTSAETLFHLCEAASYRVFDVNLRKPFIDVALIQVLMKKSQLIKLNDDELLWLTERIRGEKINNNIEDLQQAMQWLQSFSNADTICVTRGAQGALLLHHQKNYAHFGFAVTVKDTIGSGDSFLATLLSRLLQRLAPDIALTDACAIGALVATHKGANPFINEEDFLAIKR